MWRSWAGVVTHGLRLWGRLDVLPNSLKRLWRWLMEDKLTFDSRVTALVDIACNRVWLQTCTCTLRHLRFREWCHLQFFYFLFCSIYWLFFVWISQHFTTVARWWRQKKKTKIQCHLQSLLALSATCDVTCIRRESCALPTETRHCGGYTIKTNLIS